MHLNILNQNQVELLPFISLFKREYYLVGGTAIALHIGHRESIDFDLFKLSVLRKNDIYRKISASKVGYKFGYENYEQLNLIINNVKFTFFSFPHKIPLNSEIKSVIKMPDLLTLAAMKAFALGRRAKWKDYVDLYFILKDFYSFDEIAAQAELLFGEMFSKKLFKMQLGYFKGINYEEEVTYIIPNPPTEEEIQSYLIEVSISGLA
ncbi:nucleotidyl transferase AbiEii/AbiGii toxin family protein [Flavobacterium filum]|uniref:nucleotidyl transferase AbiEii/AbiGii toxin family protein n=1 Tax=Flavobacterium filum TaxID=370974 RepID=UPI00047B65D1|nr:nucleotidyl transferase AbiEii/AbiGii toxin family protein [Flavobacterium filum]